MLILRYLLLIEIFAFSFSSSSQDQGQVLRGTIKDNVSESPIPGAKVIVTSTDPVQKTLSDVNGVFRLTNIPVGRHDLLIVYPDYEDVLLKGIVVDAGKETVINVLLIEKVQENEEVTVTADRDAPINEMSVVSTKTFSVEETQKFAGAMNDPARMATSFAGVINTAGFNNDISIRGNSPRGLIWRMEGVEIPNPNHFSNAGTSGGGISIISSQLMGTSDFSTGAFAAEYGNALSGIFDLGLRKGNNEKREYTIQTSVIGLDAAIEGPFKKGYGGSYLINYRFSTLDLLTRIVPFRDNVTKFQDLSFNIYLPTKRIGNFGIFGFGGYSSDTYAAVKDSTLWIENPEKQLAGVFTANTGVSGLWHKIRLGEKSYLKTNLAYSGTNNGYYNDSLDIQYQDHRTYNESFIQSRFTFSSSYIQKISSKSNFRLGVIFNQIGFKFKLQTPENGILLDKINDNGKANTFQSFVQYSHKFSERFTSNIGIHYLQLFLNNTWNVEPRVSMNYKVNSRNTFAFGYGFHSQIQPLGTYYARDYDSSGQSFIPNKNLDLNKAHHFVGSYSFILNENHRLKAEIYYQYLLNIPVGASEDSTFSILNSPSGYEAVFLQSTGIGKNYGLELTFERSINKDFYYLISGSLYNSIYQALNGEWFDTRYNTNYILNITGGKEWMLKNPEKRRTLSLNLKSTLSGGMRYTDFNFNQLDSNGIPSMDYQNAYGQQMPPYYKLDIRFGLKRNYRKVTGMAYIDVLNALNIKNPAGQYFDPETGEAKYFYHFGIMPILGYKLTF